LPQLQGGAAFAGAEFPAAQTIRMAATEFFDPHPPTGV
jgi:hypothetical protein